MRDQTGRGRGKRKLLLTMAPLVASAAVMTAGAFTDAATAATTAAGSHTTPDTAASTSTAQVAAAPAYSKSGGAAWALANVNGTYNAFSDDCTDSSPGRWPRVAVIRSPILRRSFSPTAPTITTGTTSR
jgi:hypothetical protein